MELYDRSTSISRGTLRRQTAAAQVREHTLHLINLLESKTDAVARHWLYRSIVARRGMRGYEGIFDRMIEADEAHVDWLREQITRSVMGR